MSSHRRRVRPSPLRHFCALTAVLGLLFAATVASVTHSVAMPMMPAVQLDVAAAHHGGSAVPAAEHDCSGMAEAPETDMPSSPCEQGCLLCKSCSLASVVLPAAPSVIAAGAYHDYQPARILAPAGITPAQPNEPPRR